jgi:hypothetical protein
MHAYPLSFPSPAPRRITFRTRSAVGVQSSPLTMAQTVYAWPGDLLMAEVESPTLDLGGASAWIYGFLVALNNKEGTFLMGPGDAAGYAGAAGSWAGSSPLVHGAHAAGSRTLLIKGLEAALTWKAGDWLQVGSGSASRLHVCTKDGAAAGSPPGGSVEIWPRTRAALADGDAVTLASPRGLFRLAQDETEWSIDVAQMFGVRFSCMEARE